MVHLSSNVSIIILNFSDLNVLIKRERVAKWIKKVWPNHMPVQETYFKYNDIDKVENTITENLNCANINQKIQQWLY